MSKLVKITLGLVCVGVLVSGFLINRGTKITHAQVNSVGVVAPTGEIENTTVPLLRVEPAAGSVVLLNTEVDEESVDAVIMALEQARLRHKSVYLVISSPGGSVISGAKLIAYMEGTDIEVNTVCSEICASMAFHIFETGKNRYMVDKSFLMGHPAAGGLQGTFPEMTSLLTSLNNYVDRMDMKIAKRAGMSYEKFAVMVLKNLWIESQDAVRLKLADSIIHMPLSQLQVSMFNTEEYLKSRGIKIKTLKDSEIFKQLYETP